MVSKVGGVHHSVNTLLANKHSEQKWIGGNRGSKGYRKRQEPGREKSSGVLPYSTCPGSIRE